MNGLTLYGHLLAYFAQLQLYVNFDRGVGINNDPALLEGLESFLLNFEIVGADGQIRKIVEAALVCVYGGANTSLGVDSGNRGANDHAATRISHNPGDTPSDARPDEG